MGCSLMSTIVRLGYVAMSVHLENSSSSQTMTFAQFQRVKDHEVPFASSNVLQYPT